MATPQKSQITGCKFRRQHPIKGYIVDFCCLERNLIIEIDGGVHYRSNQSQHYDLLRQQHLEKEGYQVLRFTTDDITQNLDEVLQSLIHHLTTP